MNNEHSLTNTTKLIQKDWPDRHLAVVREVLKAADVAVMNRSNVEKDPLIASPNLTYYRGYLRWIIVSRMLELAIQGGRLQGITSKWIPLVGKPCPTGDQAEPRGCVFAFEMSGEYTSVIPCHLLTERMSPRDSIYRKDSRIVNEINPLLNLNGLEPFVDSPAENNPLKILLVHGGKNDEFAFFRAYTDPDNKSIYRNLSDNIMELQTNVPTIDSESVSKPIVELKTPVVPKELVASRSAKGIETFGSVEGSSRLNTQEQPSDRIKNEQLYPERITQARELAGFSKTDLAKELDLSVAAVSQWEDGSKNPTTENLVSISKALRVDFNLLMRPIPPELLQRGPITFRARSAVKTGLKTRQAIRLAELVSELFIWLEKWVSFPKLDLPRFTNISSERAASDCRKAWGLGDRPILHLGELFESKGIRLCATEFGDDRFDAFSCMIGGRPFAFLEAGKSDRARARFSVAHELGHLVLHQHLSDEDLLDDSSDIEAQSDAFAGAFLMPAETFSQDVLDPSIEGFKNLKPKWGVSIRAMIRRAKDLEIISQETYQRHCRSMNSRSWGSKAEPLNESVPLINRTLGKSSLELLQKSDAIKPWDMETELRLPNMIFKSVFDSGFKMSTPLDNGGGVLARELLINPNDYNRN